LGVLARRVSTGDERALEELLKRLHVPVARYYHAWLDGSAGGATQAEALAQEALVRIAREPFPDDGTDPDVIAHALRVAHALARDLGQ
jgi:DNA-directed RNA polymerase specialized sigma24 family protein